VDESPVSLESAPDGMETSAGSRQRRVEALGSGIVATTNGYIMTSRHVVEDADRIVVRTASGEEYQARLVGADQATDIAVLRVEATNLQPAKLADSNSLRVGDVVLAIGNPFGVGQTVTSGIISATRRGGFGITDYENFIQTDAPINPGNSGGALVDATGSVIGVSIAILTSGGGSEGVGLAVPINLARNVAEQIISRGKVIRGYLGVWIVPLAAELGRALGVSPGVGALVGAVATNSPATTAGLEQGDVILEMNGSPVRSSEDLRLEIAQNSPGTRVELKVLRQGKQRLIQATLSQSPG
jgi:S1-C subfamily serine protease